MPDREVKTIKDLIFYQYSKIIAKRAFSTKDGRLTKRKHYGFIKKTFRELKNGIMSWSEIFREDRQFAKSEEKCIYCGSTQNRSWEHIIPRTLLIKPECESCDKIQGIHNQVWACK